MISFSIDKQRGKVNAEWMSRPVDSIKKSKINQPLASVLISMEQSPTFAYRLKRKLLSGPIIGGAYSLTPVISMIQSLEVSVTIESKYANLNGGILMLCATVKSGVSDKIRLELYQ